MSAPISNAAQPHRHTSKLLTAALCLDHLAAQGRVAAGARARVGVSALLRRTAFVMVGLSLVFYEGRRANRAVATGAHETLRAERLAERADAIVEDDIVAHAAVGVVCHVFCAGASGEKHDTQPLPSQHVDTVCTQPVACRCRQAGEHRQATATRRDTTSKDHFGPTPAGTTAHTGSKHVRAHMAHARQVRT